MKNQKGEIVAVGFIRLDVDVSLFGFRCIPLQQQKSS